MLKVGLITDGAPASDYVADLVTWISTRPDIEISAEVVQRVWFLEKGNRLKKLYFSLNRRGVLRTFRASGFKLVVIVDQLLTKLVSPKSIDFLEKKLEIKAKKRVYVEPNFSKSGFFYEYKADDITKIKELGCDVLIRCGSGILKGEILSCVPFGVLSFHHGDNSKFRGGPPGFWEVFVRQNQTGFVLQTLTETLDGGDILIKGLIGTKPLYTWNRASVLIEGTYAIFKVLSDLSEFRTLPEPLHRVELGKIYKVPSLCVSLRYLCTTMYLLFKKVVEKIFKSQATWSVYIFRSTWSEIDKVQGVKITCPDNCFIADPFVIQNDSNELLFVEEFSYAKKKAHIAVYEVGLEHSKRLGVALSEDFHISFPFIFKYGDEFFMCPETIEARQVRLYRATKFPFEWELSSIILNDICAADPMIFFKNNKWWLVATIDPKCSGDSHGMLNLFYSDSLTSGSWIPVKSNPLMFDATCGRNGGLLKSGESLVRVGQVQGFNLYGESLRAFEVIEVTENCYREVEVSLPTPKLEIKFSGTHHISSTGLLTAIDVFSRC